jgi:carbon starvation protein
MNRIRWIWLTLIPMAGLVIITMTASYQKIFDPNPRLGFLSYANALAAQIAAGKIPVARIADTQRVIFNQRLDAAVTAVLAAMIIVLIIEALLQWYRILSEDPKAVLHETAYVATRWPQDFSGASYNATITEPDAPAMEG